LAVAVALLAVSGLGCGGHQSMESGKTDDEMVAQTQPSDADGTVKLSGEDESSASFEEKKAAADAERASRVAAVPSGSTRSGAGKLDTVTVRDGDSLWSLADRKDVYGSGYLYPLLLQANKAKIKDPNHLPAGLRLTVPRDVPDPQVEIAKEQAMTGELLETEPAAAVKPVAAMAAPTAAASAPLAAAKGPHKGRKGWVALALVLIVGGAVAWRWKQKGDQA
jgi:hypothetical protein